MINKKLGYYLVDNLEFDSKIKACIYASENNKEVKWIFNDNLFNNYPWHNEPAETLDQLYDLRAVQLRETYDYIIISYSGGADSHNIVSSFIRQGLHIDELVINTMESITDKFTVFDSNVKNPENAAAEHRLQTIPRLKEIEKLCPKTKITVLDLSDYLMSSWLEAGDASWILDKREGLNPLNVTRFNYIHFNDIRKQFDRNKKIGLILGVEKPRTVIGKENKFYIQFSDRAANIITIENHIKDYTNATVEYFYWSPDSVRILAKQAHVIKRWTEQDQTRRNLWHWKTNNSPKIFRQVHERVLRTLIYTTWNNLWYQADKATKDWYSEFDDWFINGFRGTTQHEIWKEGILYVENRASPFVNRSDNLSDGLQVFLKHYFIGSMKSPPIKD
jgi:hypothetical protein